MDRESSTPTISEDIARRLRALIHAGDLGPGDRLPAERELAKQMGVARVSLREALRFLQAGGYVEVRRGATGGTFITELDQPYSAWLSHMRSGTGEIGEILDLRIGLETHAARLAAGRRTDDDLAALAAAIHEMTDSASRLSFRNADARFHNALARASRNSRLETAIANARGEMFLPIDTLVYTELVESSSEAHVAIYQAIKERDAEGARLAMERHLVQTRVELDLLLFGPVDDGGP